MRTRSPGYRTVPMRLPVIRAPRSDAAVGTLTGLPGTSYGIGTQSIPQLPLATLTYGGTFKGTFGQFVLFQSKYVCIATIYM